MGDFWSIEPRKLILWARMLTMVWVISHLMLQVKGPEGIWVGLAALVIYIVVAAMARRNPEGPTFPRILLLDGMAVSVLILLDKNPASPFYLLYFITILGTSLYFGRREIFLATLAVSCFYLVTMGVHHYYYKFPIDWLDLLTQVGFFAAGGIFLSILAVEKQNQKALVARITRQNKELQSLIEVAQKITSTLEVDKILELVAEKALESLPASACLIFLVDRKSNTLQPKVQKGFRNPEMARIPLKAGAGFSGQVFQTGEPKTAFNLAALPEIMDQPAMRQLIKGNGLVSALAVPIKFKGRITGVISVYHDIPYLYGQDEINLLTALASQAGAAIHNARVYSRMGGQLRTAREESKELQQEMDLAAQVQQVMLPVSPVHLAHMSTYMGLIPAKKVGGDFFDYFPLGNEKWGLIIGDVMGHGLQAAMMMTQTRAVIKTLAFQGFTPGRVLTMANRILYQDFNRLEMFATVIFRIYDARTRTLCYSNAAHCPTIFYRSSSQSFLRLEKGGFALGMFPDSTYEEECLVLNPGDVGIGYSDGLLDAQNAKGEKFGRKALEKLLVELAGREVKEIYEEILQRVKSFAQGELKDDLTLIVTKLN